MIDSSTHFTAFFEKNPGFFDLRISGNNLQITGLSLVNHTFALQLAGLAITWVNSMYPTS